MENHKQTIPETFSSVDDIQEFWEHHSTADFSDDMIDAEFELSPDLKSKLEKKKLFQLLDIPPDQVREIEAAAKSENMESKEIIRKWVLEHV